MTDREAFEKYWYGRDNRTFESQELIGYAEALELWQAAIALEREECAKLCEAIQAKTDKWGQMAGYCAEQIRNRSK